MKEGTCNRYDLVLLLSSLVYIILPYIIFFIGWFKPEYSFPFVAILLIPIFIIFKDYKYTVNFQNKNSDSSVRKIVLICFLLFLWVALSGNGGFLGYQNPDHDKHNALLRDLITYSWPVYYEGDKPLVYYLAYYLPSAAVGKISGWNVANFSLFVWTYLGVLLTFAWFSRLINNKSIWLVIFFIFFSGLEFLGLSIFQTRLHPSEHLTQTHLEWWANWLWAYPSNTTLLLWVPQQAIPGWILTAIIVDFFKNETMRKHIPFVAVLSIFWSPFATVGLFIYVAYVFLIKIKDQINMNTLIFAPIIFFTFIFYYFNGYLSNPMPGTSYFMNLKEVWFSLLAFEIFEFGIYAGIAFFLIKSIQTDKFDLDIRLLTILSLVFLILLPLYHLGQWNDLVTRACIPGLFIFQIFLAKKLTAKSYSPLGKYVLVSLLSIGAITPLMEINRGLHHLGGIADQYKTLLNMHGFTAQYMGSVHNFIFKNFAKSTKDKAI
jgi:hypothetical protein